MLDLSHGCVAGKIILLNCVVLLIVGITCQCKPQQAEPVLVGLSSAHSSPLEPRTLLWGQIVRSLVIYGVRNAYSEEGTLPGGKGG